MHTTPAPYDSHGYPVQTKVNRGDGPGRIGCIHWLLAIPHMIILYGLGIAQQVVSVIAWFAILFTGRFPDGLWDFSVGCQRWSWRVSTYVSFLHGEYPPFSLDSGANDPVNYPPSLLAITNPVERNRLTCALRIIWAIPAMFFAFIVGIGAFFVAFVAWWALLFTGRVPDGMWNFLRGANGVSVRFNAYSNLLVDAYPPFELETD